MEITISSTQILAFCALITSLWGVWKIVKEWKKPNDDLKHKVEKHEEVLDADNRRLKDIEDSNKMMLQCLLAIINHSITGNGIDKMKQTRDELQEFLIQK